MYRYYNMTVTDTKQVRIKSELRSQIEYAISSLKERNIPKYASVPDFVQEACVKLLNKEGVKTR